MHVQQPQTNLMIESTEVDDEDRTETSAIADDETASQLSSSSITPPSFSPLSLSPCPSDMEEDAEDVVTMPPAEEEPEDSSGSGRSPWCGYKLVADNVDKNVSPSFQRLHGQAHAVISPHACICSER